MKRGAVVVALSALAVSCLELSPKPLSMELEHSQLSEEALDAIEALGIDQDQRLLPDVVCAQCHPRQAEEYARSTMRYGFFSPTFNALEQSLNQLSNGEFSHHNGDHAFCSDCHAPRAISEGLIVTQERMSRSALSPQDAREGAIGCDLCHSQHKRRDPSTGLIALGSRDKLTVNEGLSPNRFHGYLEHSRTDEDSLELTSSDFCAPCHDVRPHGTDAVTGEDQLRSEDLFSEWKRSPWANADHPLNPLRGQSGITGVHDDVETIESGEQVTCQDCHMSLYPWRQFEDEISYDAHFAGVNPNTLKRKAHKLYPVGQSATQGKLPSVGESVEQRSSAEVFTQRRVSTHYFTGVSQPLTPFSSRSIFDPSILTLRDETSFIDERQRDKTEWNLEWSAWISDELGIDPYGFPRSIIDRREALLKSALTLDLEDVPEQVKAGTPLRIDAWLENVGAGHNVPAGFSQERELWVSVVLSDEGSLCEVDDDCHSLLEPPLFLDAPNRSCLVRNRQGEVDRALPIDQSWELAARRERSAVCGVSGRCVVYRSGYLIDEDRDGHTHDEDLRHRLVDREIETFDERCVLPGPDADMRLRGLERGIVHFTNSLQRVELDDRGAPVEHPSIRALTPSAEPYDPFAGVSVPVLRQDPRLRRSLYPTQYALYESSRYRPAPPGEQGVTRRGLGLNAPTHLLANRAFNGQALSPFEPRLARYDVVLPDALKGPLKLEVKVRFRFFSPRTLYTLIARHPEALREEMVDEGLKIIDMVSGERLIEVSQ